LADSSLATQLERFTRAKSALPQPILSIKRIHFTCKKTVRDSLNAFAGASIGPNVNKMSVHVVEARRCPFCQHIVNTYVDPRNPDNTPHDGDISVCANCSGLSVFQGHELRLPTPAELARSMRDKNLLHTIKELRAEQYGWSVF
jgi:hypothetical protein